MQAINAQGGKAVGLSGKDANLMVCEKDLMTVERDGREVAIDLGFVGRPVEMNPEILARFLGSDFIPVVAPVGAGRNGETYNVNGDTAAGAIAAAMKADRLLLLTDVAGVKDADGAVLTRSAPADVREMTAAGPISGGMIPKTQTALDAIDGGVRAVVILDGRAPHAVLLELFTAHGAGTPDPRLTMARRSPGIAAAARRPTGWRRSARLHPGPGDGAPAGCATLVLLGPDGPGFWSVFRPSPEYRGRRAGSAEPLVGAGGRRRWPRRSAAQALFPFGGPPWRPFTAWARRSGEAWASPVGLLVHARLGLFVSYRGALALARAARSAPAGGAALRRLRRALPRPPARSGRSRARRIRPRRLPRLARHRARPGLPGAGLRGAAGLPGGAGPAARGAIGLPHGGLSWQAEAMRRLILMRHAKSSWADPGQRDLDRPLNKRGRRGAGLIGGWLKRKGYRPEQALVSTRAAGAGDLGRASSPPPARRRRPTCRSSTTPAPETMLGVAAGGARRGARADARAPAGHRRLRARGCWRSRRRTPTSPSSRPAATAVIDFDVPAWRRVGWERGRLADFVVPRPGIGGWAHGNHSR